MNDKTVLVIAEADDTSADMVCEALQQRGRSLFRLDTADFPQRASFAASPTAAAGTGYLETEHGLMGLSAVGSVYRCSPAQFEFAPEMSGPERRFATMEAVFGFGGVLASLPCRWINHPSRVADAEYKPCQLGVAARCGFQVPRTLITNDGVTARSFIADLGGEAIYKSLSPGVIAEANALHMLNASLVTTDDIDNQAVSLTASLFQQWIPKKYDVRLTAVGGQCFSIAVHTADTTTRVDWRNNYDALAYELIKTPEEIQHSVARYLDALHLVYGAFDFSVTNDGWWFLECNPNGQWGWLEDETGAPIAAAIADALMGA